MSSAPIIRAAETADETALAELDRRSWSTVYSVQPRSRPPYPPFFDSAHRPSHLLVAELGPDEDEAEDVARGAARGGAAESGPGGVSGIVGFIRVAPPTPLLSNAHVRQIQGLVVDARVRGHGVGRALLNAAVERARERGAARLTLRVLGHNTPARALYASAGFTVEGVLPGEFLLNGEYVDDVLMGLRLTP
jgi:ribosomal protein S18 acetylase RimI-like enzyme